MGIYLTPYSRSKTLKLYYQDRVIEFFRRPEHWLYENQNYNSPQILPQDSKNGDNKNKY